MKYLFIIALLLSSIHANNFKEELEKAKSGDLDSQNRLGEMFYLGKQVEQNYTEAAEWFQKAANKGHDKAKMNLGLMFYKGEGVKEDKAKAYQIWSSSAKEGNTIAQKYVDGLCKKHPSVCK